MSTNANLELSPTTLSTHKAALFPRRNALVTAEMRQALFLNWGTILPPLLLAVRSAGHDKWIDDTLSSFFNLFDTFTDPDFQEPLSKM